jgi:hypothetical protein
LVLELATVDGRSVAPAASLARPASPRAAWEPAHGFALDELHRRVVLHRPVRRHDVGLDPDELGRWLLERRLAERLPDGRLRATSRGVELGEALDRA